MGVNNSGKSSLLKFFYEFRHLFQQLSSRDVPTLRAALTSHTSFSLAPSVSETAEVFSNASDGPLELEVGFEVGRDPRSPVGAINRILIDIPRRTNTWGLRLYWDQEPLTLGEADRPDLVQTTLHIGGTPRAELSALFDVFKTLSDTQYFAAFRNAINIGANENYFDLQVGEAFIRNWRQYKSGPTKSQNEAALEITEGIRHIFGFSSLEINPSPDDRTLQLFINRRSFRLSEVGSGLAQFILVLANAAIRRPRYILIDEPELNLHPSLQLDFLTTLGSYSQEGILFATHSIGLARASAELVYSVWKVADGESNVRMYDATPNLAQFLGELSFSGYQELGFDKILLVEGANEVKTIQQLLRKYGKDHEVVLLPLGGAQLINDQREAELAEIKRISPNIYALIDSERAAVGDPLQLNRQAFVQVCQELNIQCHVLERRSLENYLTERAIKQVKGESYTALLPYQLLNEVTPSWAKEENWRIAREMTRAEIEPTDLGIFLGAL